MEPDKLIAIFMGFKFSGEIAINEPHYTQTNNHPIYLQGYSWRLAKFRNSWDWLMPVVDRIEELGYFVKINKGMCAISHDNKGSDLVIAKFGNTSKIQKVYVCVIEAIKYINYLNNKNNDVST